MNDGGGIVAIPVASLLLEEGRVPMTTDLRVFAQLDAFNSGFKVQRSSSRRVRQSMTAVRTCIFLASSGR
jgi:hypothetical protein